MLKPQNIIRILLPLAQNTHTFVKDNCWLLNDTSDRLLLIEILKLDKGLCTEMGDGWLFVEKYPLVTEELLEGLCSDVKLVSRNMLGLEAAEK